MPPRARQAAPVKQMQIIIDVIMQMIMVIVGLLAMVPDWPADRGRRPGGGGDGGGVGVGSGAAVGDVDGAGDSVGSAAVGATVG